MGKTALIFWGGWDGHTPERSAAIVRDMLAVNGFDIAVHEGTAILASADLAAFDLIVPMVTMSAIEKPELDALIHAVRAGTGLAGFHGTMGDSFRNETEYQFMVGGQWVSHPGNIIDYTVEITRPDDPVKVSMPRSRAQPTTSAGPKAVTSGTIHGAEKWPAKTAGGSFFVRLSPDFPAIRNLRAGLGRASATTTERPAAASASAAISPAGPAPITSASRGSAPLTSEGRRGVP